MENNDTKTKQQQAAQRRQFGPGGGGPMAGMFMGGAKAKDFKGSMAKLLNYLKPYRLVLLVVFILAIASTVFTIVSPKVLGGITNQIVDDYVNMKVYDQIKEKMPSINLLPKGTTVGDLLSKLPSSMVDQIPKDQREKIKNIDLSVRPSFHFDTMSKTIIILLVLYLFSAVFNYAQGWLMSGISAKLTFKLRSEVSKKINKLPLNYFDTRSHGDILSLMTNDIDTITQSLNQTLTQVVSSIATIIGITVMMLTISWQLTLVALCVLPLSGFVISFIVRKSQNLFKRQQNALGKMNGHIEEMYAGHPVVKVFNGEAAAIEKFEVINNDLYDSGWKSQFLSGLLMPIMSFIGNLGYVGVAIIGGWLATQGNLRIGDIQAFIQYMQQFTQPITQAANTTTVLQSIAAASERVFAFLEEQEELPDSRNAQSIKDLQGNVTFEHVSFGYKTGEPVIKDFSMEVKAGQRIAIVGPTGAGKTTLVNLLMRFYDVNSGAIKIDGVDIRDLKRSELRRYFGMVLQDTWLFNGTIKENIIYGLPHATDGDIEKVAKAAQVDHFVKALPDSYHTELNESADNVSQGEKQLLTIARAMLADPPILILDEATSSVDTRTEVLIQKAMDNLMHGRTSFVIAHRLSTIRNADNIIVMNKGEIVEQGNHEQLIAKKGFYEKLYNSQFEEAN